MTSSDSAEELIKIYLDGVEVALRIAGTGAKNIGAMLIAMSKEKSQTRGKARLGNMIKSGKPLSIYTIKAEDLKTFQQEAKRYGILYCALVSKKNTKIDGMVDIMVRDEDAAKLNRIAERFNFKDIATIKKEYEMSKQEKVGKDIQEKTKTADEQFIDDIMPKSKEEKEIPSNNTKETEEKNLSEISSNTKSKDKVESSNDNKKSVKKELKEIEQELKAKEQKDIEVQELPSNTLVKDKEQENKHYKEKEQKHKGKRYKEPKHLDNTPKAKRKKSKSKGRSK